MRILFGIAILVLCHAGCLNQKPAGSVHHTVSDSSPDTSEIENIFGCIPEVEEEPLPDREAWVNFLQDNLQLDSASVDTIPAGSFTVLAQIVIDSNGKLGDVSIVKDPGYGLGKRVLNVLPRYKGFWKPAMQNNKPIRVVRNQPITFIIEEECEGEDQPGIIP